MQPSPVETLGYVRRSVGPRCFFLPCCLLCGLGACSESSGGSRPAPVLTNLEISATALHGRGELWALEVPESGEGSMDLNGDGDADDSVPLLYDLSDGSLTNLSLALGMFPPILKVGEVLVAWGVPEVDQGSSDLNGDGDVDDLVLHVHDVRSGVTTNTQLALALLQPAIGVGVVAFAVPESAQGGADLDGDGTTNGSVLHVYDSRTLVTTNAMRNVTSEITFHDHAFGFTTDEPSAGMDLNRDGDETDRHVFEMYDLPLGGIEQVTLAIRGMPLAVNADDWFLLVDEDEMGSDLNGDLDTNEGVIHEVHPHQHTFQSLGLSSLGSFSSTADGADLAFHVQEVDGFDRNGDGDFQDLLVVQYSSARAELLDPGLATRSAFAFVEGSLGFLVDESGQGQDLNDDGDQDDDVLHVLDRSSGTAVDVGLDALALRSTGGWLVFWRWEGSAGEDWNDDGDQDDVVTFYWDPLLRLTTNTGLASVGSPAAASAGWILLAAHEFGEQDDLNSDGDTNDEVYVLHDVVTRQNTNLGVAVSAPGAGLTSDGRGVLLVSEVGQGADLNGDGDELDSVLHRLDLL